MIVLPGPPSELQRLWPRALEAADVRRVLDRGTPPLRRTLRFFGPGESQVAQAFQEAGGDGDGLEVTICARSFEIHVDLVAEPSAEPRLLELEDGAVGAAGAVPLLEPTGVGWRRSCSTAAASSAGRSRRRSRAPAASSQRR